VLLRRFQTAWSAIVFVALCACAALPLQAQQLQDVPRLGAHVMDPTGTLDVMQKDALEDKLAIFEQTQGSQLVVLMVPTTQPEDIASYANRVANEWKIGRKDVGDGVLLLVAKDDRKVRIEVAKALEGAIPDLAARQIIEQSITPAFRRGDYAAGLDAATGQIIARIKGESLPLPPEPTVGGWLNSFDWMDLGVLLFFALPVAASVLRGMLGRKLGSLVTGGAIGGVALLLTGSMVVAGIAAFAALLYGLFAGSSLPAGNRVRGGGRGGFWGSGGGGGWSSGSSSWGSSGGGGFSSGGGGDFGGGGASGDW